MPYNPDIANTFFRAGEIEAWGRGIERIITACKNDGFSTPEFRYDASGIWTTFKFEYPERATTQKNDPETTQKNDPETDQQKQENVILELIKENPYIQRKELVSRLDIHESSVKRRLASLQEKGIIRHVGPNKGGYWEVQKGFWTKVEKFSWLHAWHSKESCIFVISKGNLHATWRRTLQQSGGAIAGDYFFS